MSNLARTRRSFLLLAAVVGLLALLLREQFILLTHVDVPISGDVRQYVAYAVNLFQHGVFSSSIPGIDQIKPDAFRGPGYPLFLAAAMAPPGIGTDAWYHLVLQAQAVLGTATVVMGIALGRYWLSRNAALLSGLVMAVWPHHIAATGALLSEVWLGFVLMLGMLLAAKAHRGPGWRFAAAAGAVFGFAYLINPVMLFFPLLVAIAFWKSDQARKAVWILAMSLVLVGGWAIRNTTVPPATGPSRGVLNFVQGSWPLLHIAWVERHNDPAAQQILDSIDAEAQLVSLDPARGLAAMSKRMGEQPSAYVRWYLVEKPYLLWDWDIRIGAGGVYVLAVRDSPLETNAVLRGMQELFRALCPALFLLATSAALAILFRWLTARPVELCPVLVALLFVYVTLIHGIFQAEPRYSIPYRPFELLLAVTAVSWFASWLASLPRAATASTPKHS